MEALHRIAPSGNTLERLFELREVLHLDHQMEFAKAWRAEAKLATREAPGLYQPLLLQVPHIGSDVIGETGVADPRLEVAPRMIDIQRCLLQRFVPAAITAAIGTSIPLALR